MRISALSHRTGVSQRLLRYYEEQGLLHPKRLSSGYREYSEHDEALVGHIRTLLAAGLCTALIREVLPCIRWEGEPAIVMCTDLKARLRSELVRIDDDIAAAQRSRDLLDGIISAPN